MGCIIVCYSSVEAGKKIFLIARVFGLLPFDDNCEYTPRLIVISTMLVIFLFGNTVYWTLRYPPYLDNFDTIEKYFYTCRKIFETVTSILAVIQFARKREKFKIIINNLKTIESILLSVNQKWLWSLHMLTYFGTTILANSLFFACLSFKEISSTLYWVCVQIGILLITVLINQFCAFYNLMRFCLNLTLRTKAYNLYPRLYNIIENTCENINEAYSLVFFFVLITYFITTLHQIYQFLLGPIITVSNFILVACWTAFFLLLLLQFIFACSNISGEAKRFNSVFYSELTQCNPRSLLNYDAIFYHFEQAKGFEFTANGFFQVNKSLISSMILSGTTYLVILLQYSPSLNVGISHKLT